MGIYASTINMYICPNYFIVSRTKSIFFLETFRLGFKKICTGLKI